MQLDQLKRRNFITLLGGAVAWPLAASAQQDVTPAVGFLNALGQNDRPNLPAAFRRGLSETGHVDGRNVRIAYRSGENQHERLPALAADLVGRKVAVIAATGGGASILAAMAGTLQTDASVAFRPLMLAPAVSQTSRDGCFRQNAYLNPPYVIFLEEGPGHCGSGGRHFYRAHETVARSKPTHPSPSAR